MSASLALAPTIDTAQEPESVSQWVNDFEESERITTEARYLGEQARDYVDHAQWTAEELAVLKARGQPPSVDNVVKEKIELLRGLERRGRSDPKAFPRTPVEDARADAATQALRYCADDNRFDVIRSSVYDNMLVEGYGGCEVIVEAEHSRQDMMGSTAMTPPSYNVLVNHIPWDRLFHDPHSRHPGFSDAQYLGCVIWTDYDEAVRLYPGCEAVLDSTLGSAGISNTYDDKPDMWADGKRRRVRLVQMWRKRGDDWWTATFTKGGFVEDPHPSPYLDRKMRPACPIIMRSCYVDRHNNRYGVVRGLIPRQDEINKRTSKMMHLLSVNQWEMEQGAVDDIDDFRREAAKPDGILMRNPGFEAKRVQNPTEIQGHFNMLQHAIERINVSGPNASMAGKDPREQSGRAIIAQQAGGQVATEPVADELRQWTHKVYEAMWMRIRQFWTKERWIRVTDNDKNVKFVGLNREITLADLLQKLDPATPIPLQLQMLPPDDAKAVMFGLQLPVGDPRLGMAVKVENDVTDMDVDITVEEGPDNPTMQAEQFQMIMQLPPQILMQFPPEFIIKASALRNKDDLVKMLEDHQKAQAQQQQQAQAAQQAMQHAQVAKTQAEAQDRQASAAQRMHEMQRPEAQPVQPQLTPLDMAQADKVQADAAASRMATLQRMHDMAADHAQLAHVPVQPGVGAIHPEMNPLLQPEPADAGP